jgi:hypothetical protein
LANGEDPTGTMIAFEKHQMKIAESQARPRSPLEILWILSAVSAQSPNPTTDGNPAAMAPRIAISQA